MNESEPSLKCRNFLRRMSKVGNFRTHDELGGYLFLAKWLPALRWHELNLGPSVELGNHHSDVKGEVQVGTTRKSQSTNAEVWGGATRSSGEFSVMGKERRGCIFKRETSRNWGVISAMALGRYA